MWHQRLIALHGFENVLHAQKVCTEKCRNNNLMDDNNLMAQGWHAVSIFSLAMGYFVYVFIEQNWICELRIFM